MRVCFFVSGWFIVIRSESVYKFNGNNKDISLPYKVIILKHNYF